MFLLYFLHIIFSNDIKLFLFKWGRRGIRRGTRIGRTGPRRGIIRTRRRRGPEEVREQEYSEEESWEEEQEEENETNGKSAIAFVKTCLSLVHLLFTDGEENGGQENRNLKRKHHVK